MTTNRFRLRFPFWLDLLKPEEAALAETIQALKNQRAFASSIRDGLRLIVDLRAGQLDVLFELFPWTQERLRREAPTANRELERRLDELQRLIMAQSQALATSTNTKPASGPRPLQVPTAVLPRFEDEDGETVELKKSTSSSAGLNFIAASLALQQ